MAYVNKDGVVETISETPADSDIPQGSDKKDIEDTESRTIQGTETSRPLEEEEVGDQLQPIESETDSVDINQQGVRQKINMGLKSFKASVSTVGIPDIKVEELISIVGCGDLFDGVYKLTQVTHNWSGGAIETSLACYRNEPVTKGGKAEQKVEE